MCALLVAHGDAVPVLEAAEHVSDAVSLPVPDPTGRMIRPLRLYRGLQAVRIAEEDDFVLRIAKLAD